MSGVRSIAPGPGKYQLFEGGCIMHRNGEQPIYVHKGPSANKIFAFVVFFDLRGFTPWSKKATPGIIQLVLSEFEDILQNELGKMNIPYDHQPFIKGTGDGVMLVFLSCIKPYGKEWVRRPGIDDVLPGKLLKACAMVIQYSVRILPPDLALGCGLDCGEVERIFMFGEWDYFGDKVNNAAKLQQSARNEIIVSEEFQKIIEELNPQLAVKGAVLGCRYAPADFNANFDSKHFE
jgi:class 3 adenylate cyclase